MGDVKGKVVVDLEAVLGELFSGDLEKQAGKAVESELSKLSKVFAKTVFQPEIKIDYKVKGTAKTQTKQIDQFFADLRTHAQASINKNFSKDQAKQVTASFGNLLDSLTNASTGFSRKYGQQVRQAFLDVTDEKVLLSTLKEQDKRLAKELDSYVSNIALRTRTALSGVRSASRLGITDSKGAPVNSFYGADFFAELSRVEQQLKKYQSVTNNKTLQKKLEVASADIYHTSVLADLEKKGGPSKLNINAPFIEYQRAIGYFLRKSKQEFDKSLDQTDKTQASLFIDHYTGLSKALRNRTNELRGSELGKSLEEVTQLSKSAEANYIQLRSELEKGVVDTRGRITLQRQAQRELNTALANAYAAQKKIAIGANTTNAAYNAAFTRVSDLTQEQVAFERVTRARPQGVTKAELDQRIAATFSEDLARALSQGKQIGAVRGERLKLADVARSYRSSQAFTTRDAQDLQARIQGSLPGLHFRAETAPTGLNLRLLRNDIAEVLKDVRLLEKISKEVDFSEGIEGTRLLKANLQELAAGAVRQARQIEGRPIDQVAILRAAATQQAQDYAFQRGQELYQKHGPRNLHKLSPVEAEYVQAFIPLQRKKLEQQFIDIVNDPSLSDAQKAPKLDDNKRQQAEMERGNRVVRADIQGNLGLVRQIGTAVNSFARYAVVYGGLYRIGTAFSDLVSRAVQFEDALKAIQTVSQATDGQMVRLANSIKNVASGSAFSLEELAGATQTLAQAGTAVAEIPAALKAVANLAAATGGTLASAAEVLTSAKNIFDTQNFTQLSDQLAATVNISKLGTEDLRTIFNLGAQTAKGSGVSSQQFLGAAATLSNLGIKSSTIATGLRQLMLELFNPDKQTIDFLKSRYTALGEDLGREQIKSIFQGFQNSDNPLQAAFSELRRLGVTGAARNDFRRVFDIRAENVALPLINNPALLAAGTSGVGQVGTAAEGARTRIESLSAALKRFGNEIDIAAEEVSSGVLDSLKQLTEGAADYVKRLREIWQARALEGQDRNSSLFPAIGAAVGATSHVSGGFAKGVVGAVAGATGYLGSKAAEGVSETVSTLVDTLLMWYGLAAIFKSSKFAPIKGKVEGVLSAGKSAATNLGWLPGVISNITTFFAALSGFASLKGVGELAKKGASVLATGVKGLGWWGWVAGAISLISELREAFSNSTPEAQLDALRKQVADLEEKTQTQKEAFSAYDPKGAEAIPAKMAKVRENVLAFQRKLQEIFGANAAQAEQLITSLGDLSLDAEVPTATGVRSQLSKLLPSGQTLDARTLAKLTQAQNDYQTAQGAVTGQVENFFTQVARLLEEAKTRTLAPNEQALVDVAEKFRNDKRLTGVAQSATTLLEKVASVIQFANDVFSLQTNELQQKLEQQQGQLSKAEIVRDVAANPKDGNLSAIAARVTAIDSSPPTQDNLKELERYAKAVKETRAQLGDNNAPGSRGKEGVLYQRLGEVEKTLDDEIIGYRKRLADAEKQRAEIAESQVQSDIDNKLETDSLQKRQDELNKRQADILEKRTATDIAETNLQNEIDKALSESRLADVTKQGGLLDQKAKLREAERQLEIDQANLDLQKEARRVFGDRPFTARDIAGSGDEALLSAYDKQFQAGKKARDTAHEIATERLRLTRSAGPSAYTPSPDIQKKEADLAALRGQVADGQKESVEELKSLYEKISGLEKEIAEAQIKHLEGQQGAYGPEKQDQYEADLYALKKKATTQREQTKAEFDKKITDLEVAQRTKRLQTLKKSLELQDQQDERRLNVVSGNVDSVRRTNMLLTGTPPNVAFGGGLSQADLERLDREKGFPLGTMHQLMMQESRGKNYGYHDRSKSSAYGYFGILLNSTAKRPGHGVTPLQSTDPQEQARFAADYLAALTRAAGSLQGGLANYYGDKNDPAANQAYARSVLNQPRGGGIKGGSLPAGVVPYVPGRTPASAQFPKFTLSAQAELADGQILDITKERITRIWASLDEFFTLAKELASKGEANAEVAAEEMTQAADKAASMVQKATNDFFQRQQDKFRSLQESADFNVQFAESYGLPSGPFDTAARAASGQVPSPVDELARLRRIGGAVDNQRSVALKTLTDSIGVEAFWKQRQTELSTALEGAGGKVESLRKSGASQLDILAAEKSVEVLNTELEAVNDNLKAYSNTIRENALRVNDATMRLAENAQAQQYQHPTFFGQTFQQVHLDENGNIKTQGTGANTEVMMDVVKSYGQLDQVNFKALAGDLNDLSYAFNKLGKNLRSIIVNGIDTLISSVAERIVYGTSQAQQLAIQQANTELQSAVADARYNAELRQAQLNNFTRNVNKNAPGYSPTQDLATRQRLKIAAEQSRAADIKRIQDAELAKREAENANSITGKIKEVGKEGLLGLTKTALLYPFQKIFESLGFGERGSDISNALWVKVANLPGATADSTIPGVGGESGGVLQKGWDWLKGIFGGEQSTNPTPVPTTRDAAGKAASEGVTGAAVKKAGEAAASQTIEGQIDGFFSKIGEWFTQGFTDLGGFLTTTIPNFFSQTLYPLMQKAFTSLIGVFAADGGLITSQGVRRYKQGGKVKRYAAGGAPVDATVGGPIAGPGSGTSDSIPAWLSNGEYVLTAAEVNKIGVNKLNAWKASMAQPAKFASGGLVGALKAAQPPEKGGVSGTTVNIMDQRSAATSEPVSIQRKQLPDNREQIDIIVRDSLKRAITSGALDRTMASNYGTRRAGSIR